MKEILGRAILKCYRGVSLRQSIGVVFTFNFSGNTFA